MPRHHPIPGFVTLDTRSRDSRGHLRRPVLSEDDLSRMATGREPQGHGFWAVDSGTDSIYYVSAPAAELAAAIRGEEA